MASETATLRSIQRRDMRIADAMETLVRAGSIRAVGTDLGGEPVYGVSLLLTAARVYAAEQAVAARGGAVYAQASRRREQYAEAVASLPA